MHKAHHTVLKQPCAVKVVSKQKLIEHNFYLELMYQELRILERLDHPHVVRVFDLLEDALNIYIVMEFIEGGNLLDLFRRVHKKQVAISEKEIGNLIY